jgi:NDP-sugar pyrophosphorylase family protein
MRKTRLTATDFFELADFDHATLMRKESWVWQCLADLDAYLAQWFEQNDSIKGGEVATTARLHGNNISIGEGTIIEDGVCIVGPTIIGKNCEIRHGAYVRGNVILGDNAVLGHASEIKNSILLNHAKAPHFAYVGDSILGNAVNLGAGTKLSNLAVSSEKNPQGERPTISIPINGELIDTGLAKLGAIIGDYSQTGCNAVTNPGTLIGKNTLIYPNLSLSKGYYADNKIVKLRQEIESVTRQP